MYIQQKIAYERNHSLDLKNGECCICSFPLELHAKGINATATKMSKSKKNPKKQNDFDIIKEHKFQEIF